MKCRPGFLLVLVFLSLSGTAFAVEPGEMLSNPKLEARARHISEQLRCLVCQNESIDDSDADLAHDLRVLVRQRLLAGDSDDQVKQYLVARYGDYVLLDPPFMASTYALWLGPPFLLLMGLFLAWRFYFQHKDSSTGSESPLSGEEKERLASLISRKANVARDGQAEKRTGP